jgi:hypothetical protein
MNGSFISPTNFYSSYYTTCLGVSSIVDSKKKKERDYHMTCGGGTEKIMYSVREKQDWIYLPSYK